MTQALTTTNGQAMAAAPPTLSNPALAFTPGPHVADPIPSGPLMGYSRGMIETLKATVAKGAPDEQLVLLMTQAVKHNLNPILKELWCINMAGEGKPAQWLVAPSRDGYLRAARRHPDFGQMTSGVVRDGDEYEFDGPNNHVTHRKRGMNAKAPIIGAWAIVTRKSGSRQAKEAYLCDVNRGTPIWNAHTAKMVEKCAQALALKAEFGLSDIYTKDLAAVAEIEARWQEMDDAILVAPTHQEYDGGFPSEQPAAIAAPAAAEPEPQAVTVETPKPKAQSPKAKAWAAFAARCDEIAADVEGATPDDVTAARAKLLGGKTTEAMTAVDLAEWLDALNNDPDQFAAYVHGAIQRRLAAEDEASIPAPDFGGAAKQ